MSAARAMQVSPVRTAGKIVVWTLRFVGLLILYFILFAAGGSLVAPYLPSTPAEPGPLPQMAALVLVCTATVSIVMWAIHSSRWRGWKLILTMSVAFYLLVTLVMQVEAWYFLLGVTIGPELMARLFLQGLPTAFIFVPLAVLVMGRARAAETTPVAIAPMPLKAWLWKLAAIGFAYLVLYYLAGYFIAWQNPEVRAFYGEPGPARPFLQQMGHILAGDPWLTPYQLLRALIWIAGAYPVIRGSRFPLWKTALLIGLLVSVPQNIGHILPNPLIPSNGVRLSHLIETASSTFIFGLIMTWLLYPKYVFKN